VEDDDAEQQVERDGDRRSDQFEDDGPKIPVHRIRFKY